MTVHIAEDVWLSSIFGHPVFKIDCAKVDSPDAVASLVLQHARSQARAFYYSKIDTTQIEVVRSLTLAGMYTADVNVIFELALAEYERNAKSSAATLTIEEIRPSQREDVLNIAATDFIYTRFHLDPLIDNATANRIKRLWIENYIERRRGEKLLIASINDKPAAFLAVLSNTNLYNPTRTIDLIAVDHHHRRKGIADALISHLIDDSRGRFSRIYVGTQVSNIPSIRLYEKMGFQLKKSEYVLHKHV